MEDLFNDYKDKMLSLSKVLDAQAMYLKAMADSLYDCGKSLDDMTNSLEQLQEGYKSLRDNIQR